MCKTWTITYNCGHPQLFRLSTCRGIFTNPTMSRSSDRLPSCKSEPTLNLQHSRTFCGKCIRDEAARELTDNLSKRHMRLSMRARRASADANSPSNPNPPASMPSLEELWAQANAEVADELWALGRRVPALKQKFVQPERGGTVTSCMWRGSLLRTEVRAEDVVLASEGGWADSGTGWRVGEELQEDAEAEDCAVVVEGEKCEGETQDDDNDISNVEVEGVETHPAPEARQTPQPSPAQVPIAPTTTSENLLPNLAHRSRRNSSTPAIRARPTRQDLLQNFANKFPGKQKHESKKKRRALVKIIEVTVS